MADEPKLVSMQVNLKNLIEKMQEPKDVQIAVRSDGTLTASCKACSVHLLGAKNLVNDLELVWFECEKCGRVSFSPMQNLHRDVQIANEMGGLFEYEIYFMRDLPPQLTPPEGEWHVLS